MDPVKSFQRIASVDPENQYSSSESLPLPSASMLKTIAVDVAEDVKTNPGRIPPLPRDPVI